MSKKKIIIALIATTAIVGCIALFLWQHAQKKPQNLSTPILVKLSQLNATHVPLDTMATGKLIANQQTQISPKVGGYITKINFQEGDFVKAGQVLVQLDDSKQKENVASTRAEANMSKTKYQRNEILGKSGIVSPQDLESLKATYETNTAALKTAIAELNDMTLLAPFSGYLGAKNISVGDYVNAGQKLISLIDLNHLKVEYSLPSSLAPQLKLGQTVTITAGFLPGKKFEGKVSYIAPNVDADSQTIEIHAVLDNSQHQLKPGQYVNITQHLGIQHNAILVPESALFATINGYHVFSIKNNKAISMPVTIGAHIQHKIQVTAGLKPGQQIITTGQDQVKEGDLIQVVRG